MTSFVRKLALSAAAFCFALTLGAAPAEAKTHHVKHHRVHHAVSKKHGKKSKASGSAAVRVAQRHLANLGYYSGSIDGKVGPQTRAAIKKFQREHSLKATGKLDAYTTRALAKADPHGAEGGGSMGSFSTHDTVTGADMQSDVNPDYATSLNGGTRVLNARFARLDVSESGSGAGKRYAVNLNGQAILVADGQPSVIGISPTYDLGDEDAVVFTTYSPSDTGCIYRNHVLAMSSAANKLLDVDNCTRDFTARVVNGSLVLSFSEPDDARAVPAAYRLEGMSLNRL